MLLDKAFNSVSLVDTQAIICTNASLLERKQSTELCMHFFTGSAQSTAKISISVNQSIIIATQQGLNVALKTQMPHHARPKLEPEAPFLSESAETTETFLSARNHQDKIIT